MRKIKEERKSRNTCRVRSEHELRLRYQRTGQGLSVSVAPGQVGRAGGRQAVGRGGEEKR